MTATVCAARQSFVEPSVDGYGYLDGHGRPKLIRYAAPSDSSATWEREFARDAYGPPTPWGILNGEGAVLSRISFTPYGTVLRATIDGSTTWQDAWPLVGFQGLWGTRIDDITSTPWGQWDLAPKAGYGSARRALSRPSRLEWMLRASCAALPCRSNPEGFVRVALVPLRLVFRLGLFRKIGGWVGPLRAGMCRVVLPG